MAQNWSTSTDYDHNFSIKFPELPQEVYKNVPEGFKITTFAQSAECTYMSKTLVMKSAVSDKKAKAEKTINSLATKLKGKVIEKTEWKVGGVSGIASVIDIPEKAADKPQMKVQCNVIIVGKIQYQVMVMGVTELYQDGVADYFIASFRFL